MSTTHNLDVVAQDYIDQKDELSLLNILKQEFIVSSFEENYNGLISLRKAHFYTTNYDDLIEKVYESKGKKIKSYELNDKLKDERKNLFVMHINGKIKYDTETLDSIRLTMDSYDKDFYSSPWIKYFADDLRSAEAIFIVGYSLIADLELRRLVKEHKDKCFIIQHPEINTKDVGYLNNYGRVIENGLYKFISELEKAEENNSLNISFDNLKSFIQLNQSSGYIKPNDKQVFDFLVKGNIDNHEIFYQDLNQKFIYLVNRDKLNIAASYLIDGKNIIIHSDLGNGKSIFLQQLARIVDDRKFLEFEYNSSKDYYKEIRTISKMGEKVVIVFDPYNSQFDLIKSLYNLKLPNIQFLLIARSAMHENLEMRIEKEIGIEAKYIFDLNLLNTEECTQLNNIFENYGLWGKDASLSTQQRMDILTKKCHSNFQNIILYLFDKSEVKNKFEQIISQDQSKDAKKLLILSFINVVLELQIQDSDFEVLYKIDTYKQYKSKLFKEFVYYTRGKGWCIKSPIIAKAMLNSTAFSKQEIIEALIELTLNIDKIYDGNMVFQNALKHLASCSYLSFIFNYEINKKELLAYFEAVKETKFNKRNYFFWMQYAIACVNTCEYTRAEVYFETAYSFANRKGKMFSTFQIDNHYARFLLERQIYKRNPKDAYNIFAKAHALLVKSRNNMIDDRYYQFRVARCYKEYFDIFYSDFSDKDKEAFISACDIIAKNLNKYIKDNGSIGLRNDVKECRENINYILATYPNV